MNSGGVLGKSEASHAGEGTTQRASDFVSFITGGTKPEEHSVAERRKNKEAIIRGLLSGRVYWYGDVRYDFWFYLKQNHVVLSIPMVHSWHPFGPIQRLFVWATTAAASFGFLLLLVSNDSSVSLSVSSVFVAIMNVILITAATCSCAQRGSCFYNYCGKSCLKGCRHIGWIIMFICWCITVWIFSLGYRRAQKDEVSIQGTFIIWLESQMLSWCIGFFTGFGFFLISYWGCCCCYVGWLCSPAQGGEGGDHSTSAYPHGAAYPDDPDIFPGGDRCSCSCCSHLELPYEREQRLRMPSARE